jgi:competence protein ComEC
MTKSKVFLALSFSFLLGVFVRSFWEADFLFWGFLFSIIAIILVTLFYRQPKIVTFSLAILFFLFGIWRTDQALQKINNLDQDGQSFSGTVMVAREPVAKGSYLQVVGEIKSGEMRGTKILWNSGLYLDFVYGEELKMDCFLKTPQNRTFSASDSVSYTVSAPVSEGGEIFNYRMYLAKDGIGYQCQSPKIEKTGRNIGSAIYKNILALKNKLSQNVSKVIPQPEGALANGLIFGGSTELSDKLKDNFSRTGMTHIVAVSGYNVTIIAEYLILLGIFIGLWRKKAFWFAIVGIALFVLMVGAPSSAVRAGVMGGVLLWAMKNGRLANSANAILLAGSVMLFLNPLLLRYDIGFQLSFLATMGIIWLAPYFEKYVSEKYNFLDWQGTILLTLSAQIFVTPIIMYNFNKFSIISLLANLLILPIIPLSMLLVFLTAVAGLFSYYLSLPLAWLAFLPLKYEVWLVTLLGDWKWASLEINNFGWQWLVGWYGVLSFGMFKLKQKKDAE